MKKALKVSSFFILAAVMAIFYTGCQDSVNEVFVLNGDIRISPKNRAATGTELTAVYNGTENNITYNWKKDGTDVGTNSNKFKANEAGIYTVTVNSDGFQSKTSSPVSVTDGGGEIDLSGNITINQTGTRLNASYSGNETVTYQWKRNGINIGANSRYFTPDTAGYYTVTVSSLGYNSKTSSVAVFSRQNGGVPIITSNYSADPSARVFNGRLYLYPSRDLSPVTGFDYSKKDRYRVYSTDNMLDWISHNEILRRNDLPVSSTIGDASDGSWGPHYTNAMFMWTSDAAYRDNKYFFYFSHALGDNTSWENTWTIGVAQSNKAHEGFKNDVVRLRDSSGYIFGGRSFINPCIFEDDGTYYFMTGGDGIFRIAQLDSSMIELTGPLAEYADMSELQYFNEAPWMFKRDGVYYLMYSGNSSGKGDELLYAVGSSPAGPWEYKGILMDHSGTGDTSKGSVVEFNDKWYIFYHNMRLSRDKGALRSVCISELSFNPDGTILKAIQTGTQIAQNGPALSTASLNTTFGANYTVLPKYDENQSYNIDFSLLRTIFVMDTTVIVGGGANKGTGDIPAGAIHHLEGNGFAEFTQIDGGTTGGSVAIRLKYAKGDGSGTLNIKVNGGSNIPIRLEGTSGWGLPLAESNPVTVSLNPGSNNIIWLGGLGVNVASMDIYGQEM